MSADIFRRASATNFFLKNRKACSIIVLSIMIVTSAMLYYSATHAFGEDIIIAGVNEFHSMKVTSTEGTLLSMTFNGASDEITSVDLGFRDTLLAGTTITLNLKDANNNVLGSGVAIVAVAATSVTVDISADRVTAIERPDLVKVEIT